MIENTQNTNKIDNIHNVFIDKLSIFQKAKNRVLRLFREKLEEKKIKKIKNSFITNKD